MVHGGFGAPEKFLGFMTVTGEVADAHTGTDVQVLVGYPDRLADPALDFPGYFIEEAGKGVVTDDQGKFVPSNPGQKILACQLDLFEPLADVGNDLIACLGAKAVIDGFQAVNINPE
jgi:hypothetical protein